MAKRITKQVAVEPEEKAPEVRFEDFVREHHIHPGLVASFRYEAKLAGDYLLPRTLKEWHKAFEEQSNKQYSN